MKSLKLSILILLLPVCLTAQSRLISGSVLDATTREPIPFAHLFISGTTLGMNTDEQGRFSFEVPDGVAELVVSHVSYQAVLLSLSEETIYEVVMTQQVSELDEVGIEASMDTEWKRHFRRFERAFLGTSMNASQCTVTNPWLLEFEKSEGVLRAFAVMPLTIENEALGYRIHFFLEYFALRANSVSYGGKFRFEPLPADAATKEKQEKLRSEAYYGSSKHFFHALRQGTLEEDGFVMHEATRNSRGEFDVKRLLSNNDLIAIGRDGKTYVMFTGYLKILYTRASRTNHGRQTSYLEIKENFLLSESYYPNNDQLEEFGFWSTQRMAELLPTDYQPAKK